jgi:hypothetical protein
MESCIKCGRTLCPRCGAHCETGYGVAFGGGLGAYEWCPGAACDWFTKQHDPEDAPLTEEPTR